MEKIQFTKTISDFSEQVGQMSHTNINQCWHCLTCSNGCPFSMDMDVLPNAVLRMVQLGLKKEVLDTSTIWLCDLFIIHLMAL